MCKTTNCSYLNQLNNIHRQLVNTSDDLYKTLELFKNSKTKPKRAALEFMGSFHRWLYGTTDATTEAHIYKLLETNSNDTNKLAALFAKQTEIVFKELNNTSAITSELVDNIKTLQLVTLLMNLYFQILQRYYTIAFYNIKLMS